METRKNGKGWETFFEHWGFTVAILITIVVAQGLFLFMNLTGKPWIYFSVVSMMLLVSGAALILYAKIPVYRSGRFFTFGVKSIPVHLAGFYRWGWRVFLLGVILSLCLLLPKP